MHWRQSRCIDLDVTFKLNRKFLAAIFSILVIVSFGLGMTTTGTVASASSSDHFEIKTANASIEVRTEGKLPISTEALRKYVNDAIRAVLKYYGRFPLKNTVIIVRAKETGGIGYGNTNYDHETNCGVIQLALGPETTETKLDQSWMMTHEMMHLAFPFESRDWMAEGIATYIEPIGRLRTGILSREAYWRDLIDSCPKGLEDDQKGLNYANTIHRIYWGGAIYCLKADIEIRRQTKNQYGLEDALRAVLNKGGNIASDWTGEKALSVGDKALKLHVLENLYDRLAVKTEPIDLQAIWLELGVKTNGATVSFDDSAPLASVRKAIEGK